MITLRAFLDAHTRIALDTSVFIYSLEANPRYVALARTVLAWVEQPGHTAVTSTVTMTELLVKPYCTLDEAAIRGMTDFLVTYPNLEWIPADLDVADLAGRLRAAYRLKMPDALQAATAIRSGATGLVTNDAIFDRVPAIKTLVLEKLL